jgi:hypothetical protein
VVAIAKYAEQAEHVGDTLLEAALQLTFEPTAQNCDALVAASNGAIAFARMLKVELLKAKSAEAA